MYWGGHGLDYTCLLAFARFIRLLPFLILIAYPTSLHPTRHHIGWVPCDCLTPKRRSPFTTCIPFNCSCSERGGLPSRSQTFLRYLLVSGSTRSRLAGADKLSSLLVAPLTCRHLRRAKVVSKRRVQSTTGRFSNSLNAIGFFI